MSLKVQELRALVMDRLTTAADEIFALFERTFAQYEEEVLGKLVQQPRVVLYKEDIQTVTVGEDISSDQVIKEEEPVNNEQEVDPPIRLQYPISAEENRQDLSGEQCDGEEPGCSADGQPYSCSDAIQSVNVSVDLDVCSDQVIKEELMNVKQEVDPSSNLDCPSPTLKSEKSDPAKEKEREVENVTREQCDGEELGCSADLSLDNNRRTHSSSDTDDSTDWAEETSKRNGEEPNASPIKDSAEKHINMANDVNSFCRNPVLSNGDTSLDQTLRCPQCYRSFKSLETLARHAQMHTRKKQFFCKICNKGYTSRSNFNKHFRIHSANNLFRCSLCDHVFAQRRHFDEHMTIHTGERPFCCSHCGRRFRHRNSIKRHVLSQHSKEKPYSCPVCQKGFVEKKYFNAHIKKYHLETIQESSLG